SLIGVDEFEEIRSVLREERFLFPPYSDDETLIEFAATYLEWKRFSPDQLPNYFPSLRDRPDIEELLGGVADVDEILTKSKPIVANGPELPFEEGTREDGTPSILSNRHPSPGRYRRLAAKADRAINTGNAVRAAIYCHLAQQVAPEELASQARKQTESA